MTGSRWALVLAPVLAACSTSSQSLHPRDGHSFSPEAARPPATQWEVDPDAPEADAVNGPSVDFAVHDAVSLFFGWQRAPEDPPTDAARFAGVWHDAHGDLGRFRIESAENRIVLTPLGGQRVWPIPVQGTFWLDADGRPAYFATRRGVAVPVD